ncbi:HAD-like domain-containing protein [Polychytrium aggregatum]|uniref:HAD-like domain-containing protein n=1 Tax=Polychytrium aggregatum TaxID=110093 RepID=UPI0022FE4058|nr:HAD-like domain-containing protein [Polychytrium aggregatum]KAI9193725.1 HAD-like domain-containing protein [Polychytrium aggregatum]
MYSFFCSSTCHSVGIQTARNFSAVPPSLLSLRIQSSSASSSAPSALPSCPSQPPHSTTSMTADNTPQSLDPIQMLSLKELARLSELSPEEFEARLESIRNKKGFICDMDGVIYHGKKLLPGVKEFIDWLQKNDKKFLFLTNNSAPTPAELNRKLQKLGVNVPEKHFYTSAIATAKFLQSQKPRGGSCYVIGEPALTYTLYEHGFIMNDTDPQYVVIGETTSYNFDKINTATNLVHRGAKLIGTNPDVNGPLEGGAIEPGCGAFVAAVEMATGKKAFFCGKPSSLMMSYAQSILGTTKEETCIIGDRMDTDILAGTWANIDPVVVLSGITNEGNLYNEAYRPYIVLNGVIDFVSEPSQA